MEPKKVLVIGAGLGGLATALRLSSEGYKVEILEKYHQAGGRLNQLAEEGFTFDMGPSFFSMSYEFEELFKSIGEPNPLLFRALDPLYAVYFSHLSDPILIQKDLQKLEQQFAAFEDRFEEKVRKYLDKAGQIFHDTEHRVVKKNFNSRIHYLISLIAVPWKHAPGLFKSMWSELEEHFDSEEARVIFSLVAFFLGSTPFDTPAVYSLLNYTELVHDGYWNVEGGMYKITQEMVKLLDKRGVKIRYNTEVRELVGVKNEILGFKDQSGYLHQADVYVVNADAASFRGKILDRKSYSDNNLDQMDWTLAPFTIYLGVKGKIDPLYHHNYFLRENFREYADKIFTTSVIPDQPYYYVNVSSKSNPACAPEGCENLFILCPVPDLRFKKDWTDSEEVADNILADLSERIGFDLKENTLTRTIYTPEDWQSKFNLYQGSGLGLAHGMNQIGGFRPSNKDEIYQNLYYVGASTVPGTGLPIVIISSKLVTQRIQKEHGIISQSQLQLQ